MTPPPPLPSPAGLLLYHPLTLLSIYLSIYHFLTLSPAPPPTPALHLLNPHLPIPSHTIDLVLINLAGIEGTPLLSVITRAETHLARLQGLARLERQLEDELQRLGVEGLETFAGLIAQAKEQGLPTERAQGHLVAVRDWKQRYDFINTPDEQTLLTHTINRPS